MSKPEDIPQDVRRKALRLALEYRASVLERGPRPHDLTDAFASAIMAAKTEEREACALAAISETKAPAQRNSKSAWIEQIGEQVAAIIRKRGSP